MENNKELVLRIFDAIARRRPDEALSLCSDDLVWWFAGDPPVGGEFSKEALIQKFQFLSQKIFKTPLAPKVISMIAEGNQVAARAESSAETVFDTHYNNHYHFLFEFRDGKICRVYEYNDTAHANKILRPQKNTQRPDPASLDLANYVHSTSITTRYSDLDTNRHLNNVAIAELFEASRARFHFDTAHVNAHGLRGVVASLHINYLGQGGLSSDVVVHSAFGKIGNTSYVIKQLMKQSDVDIATAETTLVRMDDNGPSPLSSQEKEIMQRYRFKG